MLNNQQSFSHTANPAKQQRKLPGFMDIQTGGRLIKQDQFRFRRERSCKLNHSLSSKRQIRGKLIFPIVQIQHFQDFE